MTQDKRLTAEEQAAIQRCRTQTDVPPVAVENFLAAYEFLERKREEGEQPDLFRATERAVGRRGQVPEKMNLMSRLAALLNYRRTHRSVRCVRPESSELFFLHNSLPVLHAAARAPLKEAEYLDGYRFEEEAFLAVVLEEAQVRGTA